MKNLKKALAVSCAGLLLFAPYNYPVFPEILTAYAEEATEFDISSGSLTLSSGDSTYYSVKGTTTANKISVNGGTHNILLDNVNISITENSNTSPFKIEGNASVTLIIKGENSFTMTGGSNGSGGPGIFVEKCRT